MHRHALKNNKKTYKKDTHPFHKELAHDQWQAWS